MGSVEEETEFCSDSDQDFTGGNHDSLGVGMQQTWQVHS